MPDIITSLNVAKNVPADRRIVVANSAERRSIFWVFEGLKVYEEDSGLTYQCNVAAATNTVKPWTANADWEEWMPATGAGGATGSAWSRGGNDPNDNRGANGDFFIQTSDGASYLEGDIFQKAAGAWGSAIMNIKGADGADASPGHHGGISVEGNSAGTPQTIGTSYVQVNQFDTDELAEGTTPAHASDNITIDNTDVMQFSASLSFSGTIDVDYFAKIYVDGVAIDGFTSKATLIHTTGLKVLKIDGIYSFTAAEVVDIRVKTSAVGSDFLLHEGYFMVASMGGAGGIGVTGENFHVDDSDVQFDETLRGDAETAGSTSDRYTVTVKVDRRLQIERDIGPEILNFDVTGQILATDGTDWFLYGKFRGEVGIKGATGAGIKGVKGDDGPAQTVPGEPGDDGEPGEQGPFTPAPEGTGPKGDSGGPGVLGSAGNAAEGGYKAWDAPGIALDDARLHYGVFNEDQSNLLHSFDVGQFISKYAVYTRTFRPVVSGVYKFSIFTSFKFSDNRRWIWIDLQRKNVIDWFPAQELTTIGTLSGGDVQEAFSYSGWGGILGIFIEDRTELKLTGDFFLGETIIVSGTGPYDGNQQIIDLLGNGNIVIDVTFDGNATGSWSKPSGGGDGGLVRIKQDMGFFRAQASLVETGIEYSSGIQHNYLLRELKGDINYRLRIWVSHFYNSLEFGNRPLRNYGEGDRNQGHTIVKPENAKTGVLISLVTPYVNGVSTPPPAPILGCTNPAATNYNSLANTDDGSCKFELPGCTDPNSYTYKPNTASITYISDSSLCRYYGKLFYNNTSNQALKYRDSSGTFYSLSITGTDLLLYVIPSDNMPWAIWANDWIKVTLGSPSIIVRVYRTPNTTNSPVFPTTPWLTYDPFTTDAPGPENFKRLEYHYKIEITELNIPPGDGTTPVDPVDPVYGKLYYTNGTSDTFYLGSAAEQSQFTLAINKTEQLLISYTSGETDFLDLRKDVGIEINSSSLVIRLYSRIIGNTIWVNEQTFVGYNSLIQDIQLLQPAIKDYLLEIQGIL